MTTAAHTNLAEPPLELATNRPTGLTRVSALEQHRLNHLPDNFSATHRDAWWLHSWAQLASRLSDENFPCIFARKAFARQSALVCFANDPTLPSCQKEIANAVTTYLKIIRMQPADEAVWSTLIVLFKPQTPSVGIDMDAQIEIGIAKPIDMDVKTYHDQAWNVLQYLHDHDPKPWPTAIPTDPNDALW